MKAEFHIHTHRIGHGSMQSDQDTITAAINNGFKIIGFSEHAPAPDLILPNEWVQMFLADFDEYITSITELKQANPDIKIYAGLEAEYSEVLTEHLLYLRSKCDYLVLGQHFILENGRYLNPKTDPDYPRKYAEVISDAIKSGLFDMVVHPDLYLSYRNSFLSDAKYMLDCEEAARIICMTAKTYNIPLELNLSKVKNDKFILDDKEWWYPHPLFWNIAKEVGVTVFYGLDAHNNDVFETYDERKKLVEEKLNIPPKLLLREEFNPIIARNSNKELNNALSITKKTKKPIEYYLTKEALSSFTFGKGITEAIKEAKENFNITYKRMLEHSKLMAEKVYVCEEKNEFIKDRKKLRVQHNIQNFKEVRKRRFDLYKRIVEISNDLNTNDFPKPLAYVDEIAKRIEHAPVDYRKNRNRTRNNKKQD